MKVIIAGSRDIHDGELVKEAVERSGFQITEVVSGACAGVDLLGERWAQEVEIPTRLMPARWGVYGKAAGPIRNEAMVQYADALIAVWDGESKGTADIVRRAETKGMPVFVLYVKDGASIGSNQTRSLERREH